MKAPTENPFVGLSDAMDQVVERLFYDLWRGGEWNDEHEELLQQWRAARGDAAFDHWIWWFGDVEGDSYDEEADTRDAAIALGTARYLAEGQFRIVEACLWNDNVKEGEEISEFARTRNGETITIVGSDL